MSVSRTYNSSDHVALVTGAGWESGIGLAVAKCPAVYLLSDRTRYITGRVWNIDGGTIPKL